MLDKTYMNYFSERSKKFQEEVSSGVNPFISSKNN